MNPKVRELYKRFLIVGRTYPNDFNSIKLKIKDGFMKNKDITNEIELKKAIVFGRYWVRELRAVTTLAKYRAMKRRYDNKDEKYGFYE